MFVGYAYGVWGQRLGSSFKGKSFTFVYTYIRLEKNLVKKTIYWTFQEKRKSPTIWTKIWKKKITIIARPKRTQGKKAQDQSGPHALLKHIFKSTKNNNN